MRQKRPKKTGKSTSKSSKKPKHAFKMGSIVFFHAHAKGDPNGPLFLCEGKVVRQPTSTSPVYKVTVASIALKGSLKEMKARELLGYTVPKMPIELTKSAADWYLARYDRWIGK